MPFPRSRRRGRSRAGPAGEHRDPQVLRGVALAAAVAAVLTGGIFLIKGAGSKAQANIAAGNAVLPVGTCAPPSMTNAGACPQPWPPAGSLAVTGPSADHRKRAITDPVRTAAPAWPPHPPPSNLMPPGPVPAGGQQGAAAGQVLALINRARAQAGLPAYTLLGSLYRSASAHNTLMAGGCGLSHQCPGEPPLGARESAAGVNWTRAGENIGDGGPVFAGTAAVTQMAIVLTQDMLNEKPPDDGHRRNILSSAFRHVGIAISRSASGIVWMTQDF